MKKTYNVYSTKWSLRGIKSLAVAFTFALFFLGLSSNVSAQTAFYSSANSDQADMNPLVRVVDEAKITIDDEDVLTLIKDDLMVLRGQLQNFVASTELDEPRIEGKHAFYTKAMMNLESGKDAKFALKEGAISFFNYLGGLSAENRELILEENFVPNFLARLN